MRLVLATSAAANIVLRTDRAPALIDVLARSDTVCAPTLYHSEMANTLWKYVRAGDLDKDTALTRYEEAVGLIDVFETDEQLATEALSTAVRYDHSVYDMLFVILARRYGCKVLTVDKRFAALLEEMDGDVLA